MMRVLFFGRLRDVAGCAELACDEPVNDIAALRAWLTRRDPALGEALRAPSIRVSADRAFAADDAPLASGAEIAFMPPLSGG